MGTERSTHTALAEMREFGEEPSRIGDVRCGELQDLVRRELELLGENPARDGLVKTPMRVSRAMAWLTRGYDMSVAQVVGDAVFDEQHESMVMVRDIELYSLCEHHLLPFIGRAHVAYLPAGKVIGLSKVPRIVDMFARRLQIQENLTQQIGTCIQDVTGAAVGAVCEHVMLHQGEIKVSLNGKPKFIIKVEEIPE